MVQHSFPLLLIGLAVLSVSHFCSVNAINHERNLNHADAAMNSELSVAQQEIVGALFKSVQRDVDAGTADTEDPKEKNQKATKNTVQLMRSLLQGNSMAGLCKKAGGITVTKRFKSFANTALEKVKIQGKQLPTIDALKLIQEAEEGTTIPCSKFGGSDDPAPTDPVEPASPDDWDIQTLKTKTPSSPYGYLSHQDLNAETASKHSSVASTNSGSTFKLPSTDDSYGNVLQDEVKALVPSVSTQPPPDALVSYSESYDISLLDLSAKGTILTIAVWLFLPAYLFWWGIMLFIGVMLEFKLITCCSLFFGYVPFTVLIFLFSNLHMWPRGAWPRDDDSLLEIADTHAIANKALLGMSSSAVTTKFSFFRETRYCSDQFGTVFVKSRPRLAAYALGYLSDPNSKTQLQLAVDNYEDFTTHPIRNALLASNIFTGWPKVDKEADKNNANDHFNSLFYQDMVTIRTKDGRNNGMVALNELMKRGLRLENGNKHICKFILANIKIESEHYPIAIHVKSTKKYMVLFAENRQSKRCSMKCLTGHCGMATRAVNMLTSAKNWFASEKTVKEVSCSKQANYQQITTAEDLKKYLSTLLKFPAKASTTVEAKVAFVSCDEPSIGCNKNARDILEDFNQKYPKIKTSSRMQE